VGKLEGRSPLGRPRRRWKHDIKTDLNGIRWDGGIRRAVRWGLLMEGFHKVVRGVDGMIVLITTLL
jgi:hypothetical protein